MIDRILEESIKNKLFKGKAIVLLGPRQVGKTTLLKNIATNLKNPLWLNADNFEVQTLFETPSSSRFKAIIKNHNVVIIEEAQSGGQSHSSFQREYCATFTDGSDSSYYGSLSAGFGLDLK